MIFYWARRNFNIYVWCFDRIYLCGNTALIKFQFFDVLKNLAFVWQYYIDRFASFDIYSHMCIIHSGLLWLRRHLFHVLNDLLLELFFAASKKRSWHCWQLRGSFVQISIIKLYGNFCKHHGHRIILWINWRQLLAQKHYEKKEISLQARFGFSHGALINSIFNSLP